MMLESPLQWRQRERQCQAFCSLKRDRNGGESGQSLQQEPRGTTVVREAPVFSLLSPGQSMAGHVLPRSNVPFTLHSLGYSHPAPSPYTLTVHYRDRVPVLSFYKPGLGVGTQGLQYYTRDHRPSASWLQRRRVPLRGPNRPLCTRSEAVEEK